MEAEVNQFSFDVFISYSHRDEDWVRNDLLTELEAKGLQVCIDFRDFRAGEPSVQEMRRAVQISRKTLLVLTPEYLNSGWTEFESLMIATLDPANRQRRLIPLCKARCQLPIEIGYLTYVDFANPKYLAMEWKKLLTALGRQSLQGDCLSSQISAQGAIDDASRSAQEGIEALIELMEDPAIQGYVATFESVFQTSCRQIDVLVYYKNLHDLLHTLQFKCYNYIIRTVREAKRSPDDSSIWEAMFDYRALIYQDQQTVKRILLRLVRPSEGLEVTSNRVRRETLYMSGESRDRVDCALGKLVGAGLVRLTEGETTDAEGETTDKDRIEVAHEALVRNWPTLVGWLEDERICLRQRLRLTAAAEFWLTHGKDKGGLLGGSLLEEATHYKDLNELETEFVQASKAALREAEKEKEEARQRELELQRAQDSAIQEKQRAEEKSKTARRLFILVITLTAAIALAIASAWYAMAALRMAEESAKKAYEHQLEAEKARDLAEEKTRLAAMHQHDAEKASSSSR